MTPPANCRLRYDAPRARDTLSSTVATILSALDVPARRLAYVCIGTDRSTGDALGPLVGDRLQVALPAQVEVLGTLANPVHASNLEDALADLGQRLPGAAIIAVDACLGRAESVGSVTAGLGALVPGAGVNKTLPQVGSAHVTGTVNVGGFMEYFVLGNTRLHLVVEMAEVIAASLVAATGLVLREGAESAWPAHVASALAER